MKKIIALVLALVMILSLATVAFAGENKPEVNPSKISDNIFDIIKAGKEMLKKATDFTRLLKSGLKTITNISTSLNKLGLPGLDVVNKIITTVSTSVKTLDTNLNNLSNLIKNMENLSKFFGDVSKYFPLYNRG